MVATVDSTDLSKNELAAELICSSSVLRLRVNGSSMLPAIRAGDEILIRHCSVDEARAGDVVLFLRHRRLFAHRVISRSHDRIVTQGDCIAEPDPAIGSSELLGKVVQVTRRGNPIPTAARLTLPGRLSAALIRRSARARRLLTRLHDLQAWAGL